MFSAFNDIVKNMAEKILVVEDELALQETLAYNLKKEGYQVETIGNGRYALESARKMKPDLIVLDIMLPEMDGFEVARILRKEMSTAILMLTAIRSMARAKAPISSRRPVPALLVSKWPRLILSAMAVNFQMGLANCRDSR